MVKRKKAPPISEDKIAAIKIRRTKVRLISVSTYKSAVLLRTEEETIWLTDAEAERLGRALLTMARHRRRLDQEESAYKRWMAGK